MIPQVRKRDGRLESFNKDKIANAIHKAFIATKETDGEKAQKLAYEVVEILEKKYSGKIPSVEEIQDIVEETLVRNNYSSVAKAYILYRKERTDIRDYKKFIGVSDDLKLGLNALKVLQRRYLLRDERGRVIETPSQLFRRVAKSIAEVDKKYDKKADVKKTEEEFYKMMANLEFLPNSPTLMNSGTGLGQLSACFVIPLEDSLSSIFDGVKATAIIHQSSGGTGFSFSKLRPRGDIVRSTGGVASGPVSFMKIFDATTEEIKQGGRRRGANMAILSVYHPDIMEFITSKSKQSVLTNFNISVSVDDDFMRAVQNKQKIKLVNPRSGKAVSEVSASEMFQMIATKAWETGDPGLVFMDEINRRNPTPKLGQMESTNPCGEQPLLPYESCNLGSINLAKVVTTGRRIDWKKLDTLIHTAIHFLDNVIDANKYPLKQIEKITRANRKIGLGVMGFAEALINLGIRYDSSEGLEVAEKVMKFIQLSSHKASSELAKERDSFPNFKDSIWPSKGYKCMRNATVTTIAPTGTISIIAGCSSGIEPLFAVSFVRNVMEGTKLLEVNEIFEKIAKQRGFFSNDLLVKIAGTGSVQDVEEVPEDVKRVFVTALDVSLEWHVRMQAAFQKYTDNAVSKTINLKNDATIEDVKNAYLLSWKLKCKGITVYRYGSKPEQVLYVGGMEKGLGEKHVVADSEYSGGCVGVVCPH